MKKTKNSTPAILHKKPAGKGIRRIDAVKSMSRELAVVREPALKREPEKVAKAAAKIIEQYRGKTVWIYYPWKRVAIHCLPEQPFFELRTARNRNIINKDEQKAYRKLHVGIAGLSVGSSAAYALVQSGGPKHLKVADFDVIELTNLNRLRASVADLGSNKTETLAKQLWETDPFLKCEPWTAGVSAETLDRFLSGLDVFVDEMDNIELKIMSRFRCQKLRLPVLMATDNGDSVILDVERFDLEKKRPIFHGYLGKPKPQDFRNLNFRDWLKLATKIVGPEFLTNRMLDSIMGIGTELASVPQLGPTASQAGAAIAFACRRIASGESLPSGRYVFGLEAVLIPDYNTKKQQAVRASKTKALHKKFGY